MRLARSLLLAAALVTIAPAATAQTPDAPVAGEQSPADAFAAAQRDLEVAATPQEQASALRRMIAILDGLGPEAARTPDIGGALVQLHGDLAGVLSGIAADEPGMLEAVREYEAAADLLDALGQPVDRAGLDTRIAETYWGMSQAFGPQWEAPALAAYDRALAVFTEAAYPEIWALIHSNLVFYYTDRREGDRAENIETALGHGAAALRVRTEESDPVNWAVTKSNLAYAWLNRIRGRRAENLDEAVAAGEGALRVLSREATPPYWANAHMNLSSAYVQRSGDRRLDDLDKAIASARAAMTVYTRSDAPGDWARLQLNLSAACRLRHRDPADGFLDCAIEAASDAAGALSAAADTETWAQARIALAAALALRKGDPAAVTRAEEALAAVLDRVSEQSSPKVWAIAQGALGMLHVNAADQSPERLHRGIEALRNGLRVWTGPTNADERARADFNLGLAYARLAGLGEAGAAEEALEAFARAAAGSPGEGPPGLWALARMEAGDVLLSIGQANRSDEIERAIDFFTDVRARIDRARDPEIAAAVEQRLGSAYLDRTRGDRASNLAMARQALESSLELVDRERDPLGWARSKARLSAVLYSDRSDPANMARALALAEEALTVLTREDNAVAWAGLQANLAAIYLEQPGAEMPELLPRAIAAATAALAVFDRERNAGEWVLTSRNLASAHHRSAVFGLGGEPAVHLAAAAEAYRAALAETPRETRARDRLLTLAGLVQVLADQDEWEAVGVAADDAIATADLLVGDGLREEEVREFVGRASNAAALGAIAAARRGDAATAWARLEKVRARLLWRGLHVDESSLPAEQRAELLRLRASLAGLGAEDSPAIRDRRQALRSDIARIRATASASPAAPETPGDVPVVTMALTRSGGALLVRAGGRDVIRLLDPLGSEVVLSQLYGSLSPGPDASWDWNEGEGADAVASAIAAAIWPALEEAGVAPGSRFVWIPPPELSFIPLGVAVNPADGAMMIDRYEIVQAPSLAAWSVAAERGLSRAARPLTMAGIFNPTGDLPNAEAERTLIAGAAPSLAVDVLPAGEDAGALLARLAPSTVWHFATHGRFDWSDFRRSGLELGADASGRAQRLTTDDLLYQAIEAAPRLVMLTACESALGDIKEYPDEAQGLPTAFLQAGAAGVVAAMWKVDDLSTALLVARFYDGLVNRGLSPPAALRDAQRWLRDATADDLFAFTQTLQSQMAVDDDALGLDAIVAATLGFPPGSRPYADVKYWGAFAYFGD